MAGDPDQALIELLSPEQMSTLASLLTEVIAHGHGDVTLHVKKGSIRFIRATVSHEVPNGKTGELPPA
jgi:hypothetical protein